MQRRWSDDDRGHGIADASRAVEGLRDLARLAGVENWVAEAPEVHLLPHLRRACAEADSFFSLESSEADGQGAFIVYLRRRDPSTDQRQVRAAIFTLLGAVAETATYVRQRLQSLEFEVVTGIPSGDGAFATHGHLLVLCVI
ncbi:MAG TPA: hypothetical protein VM674_02670 [Candidatus Acidoferrum sp.]|nr:hypothetical protein [Candidatus Acidoferrum sp.]